MLKQLLVISAALSLCLQVPVLAHHGHEHGPMPTPPAPPVATPKVTSSTSAATAIQMPPAVVVPPVTPPPVVLPAVTVQVPHIAPPSTILATDTSGLLAGPDASKFKSIEANPIPKEVLESLMKPDQRYTFRDGWIPFASDYSEEAIVGADQQFSAGVSYVEKIGKDKIDAEFLPTIESEYSRVNDDHLSLVSGAVVVRAGDKPVFIAATIAGEKILVRVTRGALAMVSMVDKKLTVFNITDKCCGAVVAYLPTGDKVKQQALEMSPGQIVELYAPDDKPVSNLVATKVDINKRIIADIGLLVSRCHYVRALRKYNLVSTLAKPELDRVLKTAAAIAYARR